MSRLHTENHEAMFNRTFGLELEMANIERWKAAEIAAGILRGEVSRTGGFYDKYIVTDTQGRKWTFMKDGSIRGTVNGGCELCTPPITYAGDMDTLQELVRALRQAGAVSVPGEHSYNCGIHIHLDGKGHTVKTIRNFIHLMYANDEIIRKALEITEERLGWCKPLDSIVGEPIISGVKALRHCKTFEEMADLWYGTFSSSYEDRNAHYNNSRYHILNLHRFFSTLGTPENTVEIRAFNGTMHAGLIRAYILLALSMNEYALTMRNVRPVKNTIFQAGNEKNAMKDLLCRFGWIGEVFEQPRKHFYKRLTGCQSERFGLNGNQYGAPEF